MKLTRIAAGVAAASALLLAMPAPAFASPVQIIPWEDSFTEVHEVGEEFWCPPDVVDFEVTESFEGSGIDRITTQRDGLIRFAGTFQSVTTYSANGKSFVIDSQGNFRDHKIADNGDGTLTIWFKGSVLSTAWLDGVFMFHDSGLVEGADLIDHNGTPTNPDDDEFLGPVEEADVHGRFDTDGRDFCEDIAEFLGE
ncbi:hypothetical protein [Agromyces sp. Soil535]|uniref:hypothetical protein n=1 Tax=Agromyces sp. Soil535 TaxID=1736390 RepID=UPI0006F6E672|nr:hypothetical protein [Agromyces sp. Soil535]KRE29406.1 hypothetical protein ASG80_19880 [Agromyces sp. Soil535]